MDQRADSVAAVLHGVIFGRVAPSSRQRRQITAPTLVVGHATDPIHPFADSRMLTRELENAEVVRAASLLEWRLRPERLNAKAIEFSLRCWQTSRRARRTGS
jgi:pimeloyl-ACP methyl ester carboxylesterase